MEPLQSWITLLLLIVFALVFVWLLKESDDSHERMHMADSSEEADTSQEESLAQVIELRPAKRERHLTLVPDTGYESSDDFYDWQVQGL